MGDLGVDRPDLLERDVIDAIRANHARFAKAGWRYRYSNAGYVLLAMVVERVSGQAFDDFLRLRIFDPLAMSQTRPVAIRAKGATKGDGGIVSTGDDLLKWDQALTAGRLVGAERLAEAFVPARVEEGTSTCAFGWNVAPRNGDTLIWHTGNSGDQKAFLGRRVAFDSLGEALAAAGRREEAVKAYSRAVELDPSNVNARTMLGKLK